MCSSDLMARVKDFDAAGSGWRHAAREMAALVLWRTSDYAGAEAQVTKILADPETPAGLRQRAQMLSDLLVPLVSQK